MKLLIVTQKVDINDPILGFFHRWIEEFAKHVEKLTVICLEEGAHSLPGNVTVLSLGKERGVSKLTYVVRFYKYIWTRRKDYDAVFVHMNPEYVVLGGWYFRLLKKPVYMWYVHRQVNTKLKIAIRFVRNVFTSSKESFGIDIKKVLYMGHGIHTQSYPFTPINKENHTLLHIGRITPIKHCEVLLGALHLLRRNDERWAVVFVGSPVTTDDRQYARDLSSYIEENGLGQRVRFTGSLLSSQVCQEIFQSFATVNMTPTGGMDKVVLEALAAGRPAFTSNTAFEAVYGEYSPIFIFTFGDAVDLAKKISEFTKRTDKEKILKKLSRQVTLEYDVETLIRKLSKVIKENKTK